VGAEQAFRVADELAERQVPVLVGSALLPTWSRDDPIDASWRLAAVLHRAGVPIAFTSKPYADYQGTPDIRNLPYIASRSVAYGLPYDEALRALTLGPADVL
ncbi:MAG: amidohydrolase, partial [Gammaproteobacteria bacterium]|nr:amidohydrolase [Gemmatimonadota bacterium]NIU73680.1 amidohydrolase [Gammaproteobacteria bacterium]